MLKIPGSDQSEEAIAALEPFGLGDRRTLEQYAAFCGLDTQKSSHETSNKCRVTYVPWDDAGLREKIEREDTRLKTAYDAPRKKRPSNGGVGMGEKNHQNQNQNQNQNSKPHHTDKALGYQVELLGKLADTITLSQLKAAGEYMAGMRRIKAGGGHKKKSAAMLLKKLEESGIDVKTIEQIEKKKLAARLMRKRNARESRRGRMK